jgi:hypothetical protein
MADEARRDAKAAEDAVMRGDKLGPLHGVPVSVKDLVDVKGVPTRHGSAIFADNPPAADDDTLVKRLRAAGAIVIGKATTPEFGVKGLTDGPEFGITRNPWNLERTPGGSSGGGAAAVAAGLGTLVARHRRRGLGARSGLVLGPGRPEADLGRGAGRHQPRCLRQQRLCRAAGTHDRRCRRHARHHSRA